LKMNNDLERIGDLAVNIAKRAKYLAAFPDVGLPHTAAMAEKVRSMLKMSLDSLVNLDIEDARRVLALDDEVDEFNRQNFAMAQEQMKEVPEKIPAFIGALTVSRNLERVADLATNIAEDVIYLISGEIVRHHFDARPVNKR